MADTVTSRVVIVGGGIAALYAALSLAPRPVLVITPEPLGQGASSAWAQGGIAAAVGRGDSPDLHLHDTIQAGAGLVDPAVARIVTEEAAGHVMALASLGAPFDRDLHGQFVLSREAAHGQARVVRVQGDRAGAAIMQVLIRAVAQAAHVQLASGLSATGLVTGPGGVCGVRVEGDGGEATIRCPAVILAGGGAAGLYAVTTNPHRIRGQMLGMAARAGATIRDAEFVQFHPSAIDCGEDPAPLATEALRGEGATLVNSLGHRFMTAVSPLAELAPRDIVARAVYLESRAGRRPMLDTRLALGPALAEQFPTVFAACQRGGIDPLREAIPVTAAAHYHMGGIAVDAMGRASLPGLWACGEAACTGLHGANRLASNGLLEALVFGRRVALDVAQRLADSPGDAAPVALRLDGAARRPDPQAIATLRALMTAEVGVVRDEAGLVRALIGLRALDGPDQPPALRNMVVAATMIAVAALSRRESRGAQCRTDFPDTSADLQKPTLMTLTEALRLRDQALKALT